jgi:hypothetical protein
MSQARLDDMDLNLKLRAMRYLWHIGYFVRRNIDLVSYYGERRQFQYTDIDVLGIAFDETFDKRVIVCDCKTGVSASNTERILILGGLIRSLGAHAGIFIRDQIGEHRYAEFAERMNVRIISSSQMETLEKSIGIDRNLFFGAFSLDQQKPSAAFDLLKRFNREAYEYMFVKNWLDPPFKRIVTLVHHCKTLKDSSAISEDAKTFLLGQALALIGLAVLEFSRNPLFMKEEHRSQFARENLVGGSLALHEKEQLVSSFYDFMVMEIQSKYGQQYRVRRNVFVESVIPPYAKYIADLVSRICVDPKNALHVPRILDLASHEYVLHGRNVQLRQVGIFDPKQGEAALVPTGDLVTFAIRADLLDPASKDRYEKFLKELRL